MADRIVVLFEGRVTREFARAEATEDAIMRAATGLVEDGGVTAVAEERTARRAGARARTRSPSCCSASASSASCSRSCSSSARRRSTTPLPQRHERAAAALGRGDHRAARDRRDDRDHHAQRRPLDRLGARHLGLRRPASLFRDHPHISIVARLPRRRSAIGVACGIVNGAIVTVARVPSLVVTLGTLYIIRGIDGAWAGGNQVDASMLPNSFNKIGYGTFARRSRTSAIIAIVAVAIATYAMRTFRTARDFYAIGSDPDAARLAGIPVGVARVPRLRPQRRHRRRRRAPLALVVRLGRRDRRRRLRVPGDRRGRRRRRRDLRRQRHRARRRARRAAPEHDRQRARRRQRLVVLELRPSPGALLLGAIAFDRLIALRVAPALRTRRRAPWLTSTLQAGRRGRQRRPAAASASAARPLGDAPARRCSAATIAYGASRLAVLPRSRRTSSSSA